MASTAQSELPSPSYLAENSSVKVLASTSVILILATILLSLRFYSRFLAKVTTSWDDILLLPAWAFLMGACAVAYILVDKGGTGRHVEAVILENRKILVTRAKLVYALSWLSGFSNAFSRGAVVALYLRIFVTGLARTSALCLMAYNFGYLIALVIAASLECRPLAYLWDRTIPGGSCFDLFLFFKINAILNVSVDILIMVFPLHNVWKLHTSKARRVGLMIVFLSGSLGIIASCIRTNTFFNGEHESLTDPTWADVSLVSWTIVESGMYTCAASLIGIRPVVTRIAQWAKENLTSKIYLLPWSRSWRSRKSTQTPMHHQESTSYINRATASHIQLRSFEQERESDLAGFTDNGGIHVKSDVYVTTNNETAL